MVNWPTFINSTPARRHVISSERITYAKMREAYEKTVELGKAANQIYLNTTALTILLHKLNWGSGPLRFEDCAILLDQSLDREIIFRHVEEKESEIVDFPTCEVSYVVERCE